MNRGLWLLGLALLGAALVPLLLGGKGLFVRLLGFSPELLLTMLGMVLIGWNCNALRLRLLLSRRRPLRQHQALGIVVAAEFAWCATPGGAGAPLTLISLLARRGVPVARGSAIFAVDQLCDLLVFVCALIGVVIYALSHAVSAHVAWLLGSSAAVLVAILFAVLALGRYHRGVLRQNGRLLRRLGVSEVTRLRWARRILGFRNALRQSLSLPRRVLLAVFLLSGCHWMLRFTVLYLTLIGLGREVPWAWTFLVQMLSLSLGAASLLPGGAGSSELAAAAALAPLVGTSTAAAAIVIWRAVTYHFYLLVGAPVFLHLAGRPLIQRLVRGRGED